MTPTPPQKATNSHYASLISATIWTYCSGYLLFVSAYLRKNFLAHLGVLSYCLLLGYQPATFAADLPIIPKIIGGKAAEDNKWPWMAGIYFRGFSPKNSLFCGGTLIAKDWVLTAAHCVHDEKVVDLQVVINRSQLTSTNGETHDIDKIYLHPQFNISTLSHDIALLKLSQPSAATPVEILPSYSTQDEAGQTGLALGWGNMATTGKNFPDKLQEVSLPIISNTACKLVMTGIFDDMLCAGAVLGGIDTCEGDSGGPLMVFDNESQSWRQAGITSFGEAVCAAKGYYGVYSRLDQVNDYISSTICNPEQIPAAPKLSLTIKNGIASADWSKVANAAHYRLNFTVYPYRLGNLISSMEMNQLTQYSTNLPKGSAFIVAITAYNGNCKSAYSNIEAFTMP